MGWTLGIASYLVIWWTILFAVLPLRIKSQREAGNVVPGSDPGAPANPRILYHVVVNSIIAAAIWGLLDLWYIYYYLH